MKVSKRLGRGVCGGFVLASVVAACVGVVAVAEGALTAPPKQPNIVPQTQAVPGSGKGFVIGYASDVEKIPVVHVISNSFKAQIKRAGATLVFCDLNGEVVKSLDCARLWKTRGVDGILQFQHDTKSSPRICAAGPKVPVIAIDIGQPPCQTAYMGVDNKYGGYVAGLKAGEIFKKKFACKYDAWLSLEILVSGKVSLDRANGYQKGFQVSCPGPIKNLKRLDFDGSIAPARTVITDSLTRLPGKHKIIVTGISDDGVAGAFAAAKSAGRVGDIYGISLGLGDQASRCGVKTNPNWLASTAIFPEKYGWTGVPQLIKAMKGKKIPKLLYVPLVAVNSKNIGKYYPKLSC